MLGDSDGDGEPDALPEDYAGALVEDTDDDNDGVSDVEEKACGTAYRSTTAPTDLDGIQSAMPWMRMLTVMESPMT